MGVLLFRETSCLFSAFGLALHAACDPAWAALWFLVPRHRAQGTAILLNFQMPPCAGGGLKELGTMCFNFFSSSGELSEVNHPKSLSFLQSIIWVLTRGVQTLGEHRGTALWQPLVLLLVAQKCSRLEVLRHQFLFLICGN